MLIPGLPLPRSKGVESYLLDAAAWRGGNGKPMERPGPLRSTRAGFWTALGMESLGCLFDGPIQQRRTDRLLENAHEQLTFSLATEYFDQLDTPSFGGS